MRTPNILPQTDGFDHPLQAETRNDIGTLFTRGLRAVPRATGYAAGMAVHGAVQAAVGLTRGILGKTYE